MYVGLSILHQLVIFLDPRLDELMMAFAQQILALLEISEL